MVSKARKPPHQSPFTVPEKFAERDGTGGIEKMTHDTYVEEEDDRRRQHRPHETEAPMECQCSCTVMPFSRWRPVNIAHRSKADEGGLRNAAQRR